MTTRHFRKLASRILALFILCLNPGLSQPSDGLHNRFYYLGTLGPSLEVQLELVLEGTLASGEYFYEHVGTPLYLTGSRPSHYDVVLEEHDDAGVVTGRFTGTLSFDSNEFGNTFEGTWTIGDGERRLPFRLDKVAEYATLSTHQNLLKITNVYPFFLEKPLTGLSVKLREAALASHIASVEEGQDHVREQTAFNGWWVQQSFEIQYYAPDLISLLEVVSSYTGGAHPNTWFEAQTYRLKGDDARRVRLEDLFRSGSSYLPFLSEYVLKALRDQEAQRVVDGVVTSLDEGNLAVFTLSPRGLVFTFSAYEMGPYAQGPFTVVVPHGDIVSLVDPQGPLGRFMR